MLKFTQWLQDTRTTFGYTRCIPDLLEFLEEIDVRLYELNDAAKQELILEHQSFTRNKLGVHNA